VGVGETQYSRNSGKTELGLMLEASLKAIADAALKPHDIDGVIPPRLYATAEHFAANLGIEDLRYAVTVRMGGASPVAALQSAALAVSSGIANHVLLAVGFNQASGKVIRDGVDPIDTAGAIPLAPALTTLNEYYLPYGSSTPVQWYSWIATRYKHLYNVPERAAGAVPYSPVVIELEEGVRMVSWLVDVPPNELRLDLPVEVVFDDVTPEVTLPKFRRA
jgi:acetyl-CoA acetyltransferase